MGLILLVLLPILAVAQQWDPSTFPNPQAGQFKQCGMKTTANICDPDGVLSESARYRLDHDLQQLEARTRQDRARKFCEKKGVTGAMAVAKRIKGGKTEDIRRMANDMLRQWSLDPQCQKAVVIVVSTEDMVFWVARDDKVPVYAEEFNQIFAQQKSLFQQKNYQQALSNILMATWDKALSKQGTPSVSGGGSTGGGQGWGDATGGSRRKEVYTKDTSGGSGLPSIPKWVWLAVIFVVIPLLCCCLCCYCCCCRGKGGSGAGGRAPVPQDYGGGAEGGGGGGRSGGGMGGFLSSLGGAGIGSMIGNALSRRGGGGGGEGGGQSFGMGGGGMYQGGGSYPAEPQPTYDDNQGQGGKGLYPSVPVKDEGGGGSWA